MLSIQDIGLSIFGDTPKKFYILGGTEYGIKEKYIEILTSKFGPKLNYPSVSDVISLFSKNYIIPPKPQVYVVRYDKAFVSGLTKDLADKVLTFRMPGTLVLLYEDTKDLTKLNKFFPDNTASIDPIDVKHMEKYLKSDFPELDKRTISCVAKNAINYYQAKNICRGLFSIQDKIIMTEKQIVTLFNLGTKYSADDVQVAIASRNFNALMHILDNYDGDIQGILYLILRVMVELDKIQSSKYSDSPLKKYSKNWTRADIYYMFNHTYAAINSLRSGYTVEVSDLIVYLGVLMMFTNIPETGLLEC